MYIPICSFCFTFTIHAFATGAEIGFDESLALARRWAVSEFSSTRRPRFPACQISLLARENLFGADHDVVAWGWCAPENPKEAR